MVVSRGPAINRCKKQSDIIKRISNNKPMRIKIYSIAVNIYLIFFFVSLTTIFLLFQNDYSRIFYSYSLNNRSDCRRHSFPRLNSTTPIDRPIGRPTCRCGKAAWFFYTYIISTGRPSITSTCCRRRRRHKNPRYQFYSLFI